MIDYGLLVLAILWYVLPVWIVPLAGLAGKSGVWYLADLWVVRIQMYLFLYLFPLLARWPGPVTGPLEMKHRLFFTLFYGLFAGLSAWLVCLQHRDRAVRFWWLCVYWSASFFFIQFVAFLMLFFSVVP